MPFVGKFSTIDDPGMIAQDIQETLKIKESDFKEAQDQLRIFINKVENSGILVFKSSVLFDNTHIKLDPNKFATLQEFRGFVIADKIAPAILINAVDSMKAQIFTLFHELAHLWIGASGVSDVDYENTNEVERLCNFVAVEILMPEDRIRKKLG